ncbi:ester hydrolase C11orf54 homolog [Temnothorax longispinosus]|uniref:ester hydrolase C11orf54 homolog n=1 Tax=Temnothorax longispinosus TaxID=300112 RepID=UPI003A999776
MAMQNDNVNNNMQNDDNIPEVIDMTCSLHQPDLEELASLMNVHLAPYFNHVAANVIECPDLLAPPYFLRAPGICGDAQVIEFGNEEHLYNTSKNKEVSWFLPQYINRYTRGSCLVIGNTMSREIPNKNVGMNFMHSSESEEQLIALNEQESNYIFLNEEGQVETQCHPWGPVYCDLYGSVYVCNGKQDKVLEVYVKGGRDPNVEILNLMRSALRFRYHFLADSARVGLSGLLFITSGKVLASVMPRTFSQTLLQNEEEINGWNRNFKLSAPVIVHSTMFNFNELNIIHNKRLYREKFCTVNALSSHILRNPNEQLKGSRLFTSTSAHEMECRGYFNVVSKLHRVGAEVLDSPD